MSKLLVIIWISHFKSSHSDLRSIMSAGSTPVIACCQHLVTSLHYSVLQSSIRNSIELLIKGHVVNVVIMVVVNIVHVRSLNYRDWLWLRIAVAHTYFSFICDFFSTLTLHLSSFGFTHIKLVDIGQINNFIFNSCPVECFAPSLSIGLSAQRVIFHLIPLIAKRYVGLSISLPSCCYSSWILGRRLHTVLLLRLLIQFLPVVHERFLILLNWLMLL